MEVGRAARRQGGKRQAGRKRAGRKNRGGRKRGTKNDREARRWRRRYMEGYSVS